MVGVEVVVEIVVGIGVEGTMKERLAEIRRQEKVNVAFPNDTVRELLHHIDRQDEAIEIARKIADAGALLASNYPHYIMELRAALAKLDGAA